MSESCRRGHKCLCFQCGETDCERYESEPPRWVKENRDDQLIDVTRKIFNFARGQEMKDEQT